MENEFYKSRLESLRNEKSSISMVSNAKDRLVVSGLTFENYDSDSAYDSEECDEEPISLVDGEIDYDEMDYDESKLDGENYSNCSGV
jgi:hypothetical protein